MILSVTLNAAIDRTVAVPNFRLGRRHRAVESRTVAGGKGINVARALSLLGRPVIATGFVGGPTGTRVLEQLHEEAVLTDFTRIAAETRINLAVIDPTSGEQTEINERGPAVSAEEVQRLFERIAYLAGGAKICVLAGSVPPGAGDDLYARLIDDLSRRGVPVVLDAAGEAML
ncbi:MAG TPA: PfkB family carbohydrate kinase, partial [Solirubrobacterales bacterium]|nr:PfkB family carbohydrate kinase [Solirubrobacterales bacterium]